MEKILPDQHAPMVDNRLVPTKAVSERFLQQHGLSWFSDPENQDYFPEELIKVSREEVERFQTVSNELFKLAMEAIDYVIKYQKWTEVGIPPNIQSLVAYTFENERANHLIGRFDFAGGLDSNPLKLLEFNGDTCSLMPETHWVQDWQKSQVKRKFGQFDQFNNLLTRLTNQFKQLLNRYPNKTPSLLLSGMGHDEDWINLDIIELAAKKAGFGDVQQMILSQVIFAPDEGIFIELNPEEFRRYDFWFKMVPWEWMSYDEPDLLNQLDQIIRNDLAVVINPAYSMVLQSKGLMGIMKALNPNHPNLLETSTNPDSFKNRAYVQKPVFGRMGDNIKLFNNYHQTIFNGVGDYGDLPSIYQEFAQLDQDEDGDIYQPSIYFSDGASALCFRRQDDLIINDDAEFLGHVIPK